MPESDGDMSTMADIVIDRREKKVTWPSKAHPLHGAEFFSRNTGVNRPNGGREHNLTARVPAGFTALPMGGRV